VTPAHITTGEPVLAWRAWRVYRIETLRLGTQARLCAVGTEGVPKVWEPRARVRAACSQHQGLHEAPDPALECWCGIYGLRTEKAIREQVATWEENWQGGSELLGWAVGQVNLWGRVVEYERGWRAEFAYPYALTVHSDDATLAPELRRRYLVDIEASSALSPKRSRQRRSGRAIGADLRDLHVELERVEAELERIEREIRLLRGDIAAERSEARGNADDPAHKEAHQATHRFVRYPALRDADELARVVGELGAEARLPTARDIAEAMAEGDPALPLHRGTVSEVGFGLYLARMAGKVIQLRRGASGRSLWALPGSPIPKGYADVSNPHAAGDETVYEALCAAIARTVSPRVPIREVVLQLGRDAADRSERGRVAQSLVRLSHAGRVQQPMTSGACSIGGMWELS